MKDNKGMFIAFVACVLAIVIILGLSFYYNCSLVGVTSAKDIFGKKDVLENVYYMVQIAAVFFLVLSVAYAAYQCTLTAKAEKRQIDKSKIEKSIELAGYYKDEVLERWSAIRFIYTESNMLEILKQINAYDMQYFNAEEMQKLFDEDKQAKIEEIKESNAFLVALIKADLKYDINLFEMSEEQKQKLIEELEKTDSEKKENKVYRLVINNLVHDCLNNAEYFAMFFTHNVADETVIYQSISPSYIEMVTGLYTTISKNNKDDVKLYTNVIKLYKRWEEMRLKQKKENDAMKEKINEPISGTVLN